MRQREALRPLLQHFCQMRMCFKISLLTDSYITSQEISHHILSQIFNGNQKLWLTVYSGYILNLSSLPHLWTIHVPSPDNSLLFIDWSCFSNHANLKSTVIFYSFLPCRHQAYITFYDKALLHSFFPKLATSIPSQCHHHHPNSNHMTSGLKTVTASSPNYKHILSVYSQFFSFASRLETLISKKPQDDFSLQSTMFWNLSFPTVTKAC